MLPASPLALMAALALTLQTCRATPPAPPPSPEGTADSTMVLPPDTVVVSGVWRARARIEPVGRGRAEGTVTLGRVAGGLRIKMELEGLSQSGYHAVQILRGRDCSADPRIHLGVDAGTPHGGPYSLPGLRHVGDLGNVRGDDGGGRYDRIDPALDLDGTASPVGRAVVVRADPDDGASPDGAAGDVIGCGVFEATG